MTACAILLRQSRQASPRGCLALFAQVVSIYTEMNASIRSVSAMNTSILLSVFMEVNGVN